MSELAEGVGLGRSQFFLLFRQETGTTPHQYQLRRRMKEAEALLASTFLRVSEIAYQVGYQNAGHFSEVFRREFGVSPQEYRKRAN